MKTPKRRYFATLWIIALALMCRDATAGTDAGQNDPELKRAITAIRVRFAEEEIPCRHDAIVPYFYSHDASVCDGSAEKSLRLELAFLKDYVESTRGLYQDYVTKVGYMNASAGNQAAMALVSVANLHSVFLNLLSSLGGADAVAPVSAEDCAGTHFDDGATPSVSFITEATLNPWASSVKLINGVSKILSTSRTCADKKSEVSSLFRTPITTGELDDALVIFWMATHKDQIVHSDAIRIVLAAAAQLSRPIHGPDYQWAEGETLTRPGDVFFQESAVNTKLFILGSALSALKEVGASHYDQFPKLSRDQQNQVYASVNQQISKGLASADWRDQITAKVRVECDSRIAKIFGGNGAIASATGEDLGGTERFHVFKTMHMYPGEIAKTHGPLYAPKGYTSASAGGTPGIGSYILSYASLGRYHHVILNFNHLADAENNLLEHGACPTESSCLDIETNAAGSVRIGSTGGDGGAGDGPYDHSHINILASDGHTKLNFVDAFCK